MMVCSEDILFIMPTDPEMQFSAMSALQRYVNDYQIKMEANCVFPEIPTYKFRYWAEMSDEDWNRFQKLGIELNQDREKIGYPDAVIDLNDRKLMSFYNSEKHCTQACSALAGVEALPMPKLRGVTVGSFSGSICVIDDDDGYASVSTSLISGLFFGTGISVQYLPFDCMYGPEEWMCSSIFVGRRSWQTYALASMGLPVIEILRPGLSVNWLSKFHNAFYRVCEEEFIGDRIIATVNNLRELMAYVVEARKAKEVQCHSGQAIQEAEATP